jgi:hypothetical protein
MKTRSRELRLENERRELMETSSHLIIAVFALTLGHCLLASIAMAVDKLT